MTTKGKLESFRNLQGSQTPLGCKQTLMKLESFRNLQGSQTEYAIKWY